MTFDVGYLDKKHFQKNSFNRQDYPSNMSIPTSSFKITKFDVSI